MTDLNPTGIEPERGGTYADCFALRVGCLGNTLAARFQGRELTYAQLNTRSNQLAHYLKVQGEGPEVLVAVCLERSLELLVSLLAVWKAGGAFLPLDPGYPNERLAYLLRDSQPAILITRTHARERFAASARRMLFIDALTEVEQFPTTDPPASASAENLAYVLYTSGSTGAPKGVEIPQRALLNHNLVISQVYQLCPEDRVLQFASLSFDVALEEIFPSWLCGGTVVLRTQDAISSSREFLKFVAREEISVLNLPTAYWHELVSELSAEAWPASVRLVVIGGERASESAYQRWKEAVPPSVKLINAYGPTEATITSLLFEADRGRSDLPIGKPITNSYAAILDDDLRPVARGQTGELYLGGVGLARGYLRRPKLTADHFIPNPLSNAIPSARLYRTGDLARFRADGDLEFAGRVDDQVKIRGFRIEPGEVEAALRACPAIKDAVVVAREDKPGHKRLVAYVVPRQGQSPSVTELRRFGRGRLPVYMVPAVFVSIGALPITAAGKVDRRALPRPDEARPQLGQPWQAARTRAEAELSAIWQEVLRVRKVGVRDNFFELGGDSLLALQVLTRIRERLGVELSLSTFFAAPTVSGVAEAVDGAGAEARMEPGSAPSAARREGKPPASLVQEQLFFLHELDPQSDAYHMAWAGRIRGKLELEALCSALNQVVARHEALRTCFGYEAGRLCQHIALSLRVPLEVVSLAHLPRRDHAAEFQRRLGLEIRRPFNLTKAPLLRVVVFRFNAREHALALVMHHSIADGWSLGILFREWQQVYAARASGSPVPALPELTLQYADFAHWQRGLVQGGLLTHHLNFWEQTLDGAPRAVRWPIREVEKEESKGAGSMAERSAIAIPTRTVSRAGKVLRRRRVTPFMALLGALALSLHKWAGQTDLVIGTVVAGRNRREFENLIGCFMNFLPLRLRLRTHGSAEELLNQVRQTVFDAQSHQDCPFEQIAGLARVARGAACGPGETAAPTRGDSTRNPLFNVALLWHNYPAGTFAPPGLRVEPVAIPARSPLLDMRFEAEPVGAEWRVSCEYDSALFDRSAIARLMKIFEGAFTVLVHEPQTTLKDFTATELGFEQRPRRVWLPWLGRDNRSARPLPCATTDRYSDDHL